MAERQTKGSNNAEFIKGSRFINFTGLKNGRGEFWLIGRVWEVLCFEAEAVALVVGLAGFSGAAPIEEVAAVELDAGCIGKDFHTPTTLWFLDACDTDRFTGFGFEHVVVIISSGKLELLVCCFNACADCLWGIEIEGAAADGCTGAGGNHAGGDGGKFFCLELEAVVEDIAGALTF